MVRPVDQMTAIEKIVSYSQFPKGRGHTAPGGPHREAPHGSGGSGSRRKTGRSLYCGFCGKEQAMWGKQASEWLVCIISAALGHRGCPQLSDSCPG